MKIVKIIIKTESGYGPVDDSYKDKLTITHNSISYEFHPYKEAEKRKVQKWTYKTNGSLFERLFGAICEMTPKYLNCDEVLFCTDIGSTDIVAIYDDKSRRTEHYYCPAEYFREYFCMIRKMIPPCEYIPVSLLLEEDDFEVLPFN